MFEGAPILTPVRWEPTFRRLGCLYLSTAPATGLRPALDVQNPARILVPGHRRRRLNGAYTYGRRKSRRVAVASKVTSGSMVPTAATARSCICRHVDSSTP